ncbi:MAG: ankyrin repeat domain-containing protein [Alphaproteobacteria bacterium]|nr:ankyrin repeat domain-containing protein [Alphaproteobacteria bacterium]
MVDFSEENKNVAEDIRNWVEQNGIDAFDENGNTLLMNAVISKNPKALEEVLLHKPDLNIKSNGKTPLIMAAVLDDITAVGSLLKKGADPNIQDDDKMTALMFAAINDNAIMIIELVTSKARLDMKDKNGWFALDWAISGKSQKAVTSIRSFQTGLGRVWKNEGR